MENYWGDLTSASSITTPESILREQANLLSDLSGGYASAMLDAREGPRNSVIVDLDIHAPVLNYVITVLTLSAGATLYPVTLISRLSDRELMARNEAEFRAALKEVLGSQDLRDVVTAIISRARSLER